MTCRQTLLASRAGSKPHHGTVRLGCVWGSDPRRLTLPPPGFGGWGRWSWGGGKGKGHNEVGAELLCHAMRLQSVGTEGSLSDGVGDHPFTPPAVYPPEHGGGHWGDRGSASAEAGFLPFTARECPHPPERCSSRIWEEICFMLFMLFCFGQHLWCGLLWFVSFLVLFWFIKNRILANNNKTNTCCAGLVTRGPASWHQKGGGAIPTLRFRTPCDPRNMAGMNYIAPQEVPVIHPGWGLYIVLYIIAHRLRYMCMRTCIHE